jgi:hypothetical protein
MKSLFNPAENQEIINRINRLSPESSHEWGTMNVSQMMAHLQVAIKSALGEITVKRKFMSYLMGGIIKKIVLKDEKPFPQNAKTDEQFVIPDQREFEKEKTALIEVVNRFPSLKPGSLDNNMHPFFGPLTSDEWFRLQWKHIDHHLRQFGV